jgi:hypothetical protein
MTGVFTLPFVPEPYEDEMLGSWLARTELANGSGSWRSLLERSGYGNKLQISLFDFFEFDDRAAVLLDGVGVTYEHAMRTLSTLKFWSHLRGTSHCIVPGTTSIAMPSRKMNSDVPVVSLGEIRKHGYSSIDQHWYCSVCIAQDIEEGKRPYWRRLHQLPTTFYCGTHHVALENTCFACGASARPHDKKGWGTLSVRCDCGADRRNIDLVKVDIPPFFQRLARIGSDALSMKSAGWSAYDVHCAALDLVRKKYGKRGRGYYSVAFEALGASKINRHIAYLKPPFATKSFNLSKVGGKSVLLAPSIFAEMGIELREAMADYLLTKSSNKDNRIHFNAGNYLELGITGARQSFTEKMQRAETYIGIFSYWYLRLYDAEWLERYLGRKMTSFPTIEKDRDEAHRRIESGMLPATFASPLMFRLCMRDKLLYNRIKQLSLLECSGKMRAKTSVAELRFAGLFEALQFILAEEIEPKRITYGMLGHRVNLNAIQAMESVLAFPELKAALDKANRDKTKRQWRWAVRLEYEKAKGEVLKMAEISRRAKLPLNPESSKYVRLCIAELQEEKAPKVGHLK